MLYGWIGSYSECVRHMGLSGHVCARAMLVVTKAVIRASKFIADQAALRERRASMCAAVLECNDPVARRSNEYEPSIEKPTRHRRARHFFRGGCNPPTVLRIKRRPR
ncbi:hypothetical protein GCM10011487_54160 [Steroidobacter agaridevorans]|uniref:Uncharacterized protein n=1 Tax=Steroidobacter agaridevorans TaxID=2695856 RepID=A0A829YLP3_9GAMM|nr:hypothetical protein GCM10011487_54160 [Steroidobacter agaridevorans]